MTVASIRTNNPGAMWGGAHAKRWGATDDLVLKDGQSNHIAVFPTRVNGAAAQFDLWRRSYTGLSLGAAIRKWSGGNSSSAYMAFLTKNTGIAATDVVSASLLAGPKGLALMKSQAQWEAGQVYPMSDAEWAAAQRMVFGASAPPAPKATHPAEVPVATTVAAGTAAAAVGTGWPWWAVALAFIVAAAGVIAVIRYFNKKG